MRRRSMFTLITMLGALLAVSAAPRGLAGQEQRAGRAVATFAGGCFWCMEPPFDDLDGVIATVAGYMGGSMPDPTYEQVSRGGTGHAEVLQVTYDPARLTYQQLLDVYWRNVDPHDGGGQFCDRGSQYRSAIFVHSDQQRRLAEASRARLAGQLDQPIVTTIDDATAFYRAEDYHQDYYRKNPLRYRFYKWSCGRENRLDAVWGNIPLTR